MKTVLVALLSALFLVPSAWGKSPGKGDPAPLFTVVSMEGKDRSLDEFAGKVVLIGMFHIRNVKDILYAI